MLCSDRTLALILDHTITNAARSACSLWSQSPLQPRPHPEFLVEQRPDVAAALRKPLEDWQHHLSTAQALGLCSGMFSPKTMHDNNITCRARKRTVRRSSSDDRPVKGRMGRPLDGCIRKENGESSTSTVRARSHPSRERSCR